jgi:cytidyltransferase-like protein
VTEDRSPICARGGVTRVTKAVYPESFDPVTRGHVDVATRAAAIFDQVVVAVYDTPAKNLLFTTAERVALAKESLGDLSKLDFIHSCDESERVREAFQQRARDLHHLGV